MNLFRVSVPAFALGLLFVLACCTKSDPFGKELFNDPSGLTFTDTVALKVSVVREDSTNTSLATNLLLGNFRDPVFGLTKSVVNTNFWPGQLGHKFPETLVCDSAFIYLAYDTLNFYGDTNHLQTIEVYRTEDVISPDSNYFSHATAQPMVKIGELVNFMPHPHEKLIIHDTSGITAEVDTLGAYLKIPIDAAFGQEILKLDSEYLATTDAFTAKMRGLQFRVINESGCMMSFNFNRTSFSRMTMFFKDTSSDNLTKTFHCFFTANKWANFTHDYAGTPFENSLGTNTDGNLFVQGAAGLKLKIELPNVRSLGKIAVNQAELELTMLDPVLPGDNKSLYTLPRQLLLSKYVAADKKYLYTVDVYDSAGTGLTGSFSSFSQKQVDSGSGVVKFHLNLSDHLQDMISGKEPAVIYLNVFPNNQTVARGVFVGTGGAQAVRAKVNLKYSKV